MSTGKPTGSPTAAASTQRGRRGAGYCVAVVGADGSGKSTVMQRLRASGSASMVCVKSGLSAGSYARMPKPVRWLARAQRVAHLVARTRLALYRGKTVVWDRHPVEDSLTREEGRRVLTRGQGWARHLLPAPDLLIVLDASARTLYARRQEQDPLTLERLRQIYLRMAAAAPNAVIIDAAQPVERVCEDVLHALHNEGPRTR
jgi:thymidylate kinase